MADGRRIRPARVEEADALTALARRSKAHWPYDEAMMAVFNRTIAITRDAIAAHVVLVHETGDAVDGVGVLIPGGDDAELDHLWVDPPAIGRGVGRRLFEALAEAARRRGARRIVLNADPHAEGFYLRLGAVRIGGHPVAEIPGRVLPRLAMTL
ncbi:N-acetyltransferase [Thalassobaculum fulvum]|uniref:N-acetyltransferase n=1 Tax=Thalassobaculum fulvum TaxID=1633335 RepID=A0A918XP40_9PROT|nr:GNAT family N-acetyltransferase [Thalassobaculum fulvum]GHD41024.1 N-acetyltransferase [Thalassobaculum fulvum]